MNYILLPLELLSELIDILPLKNRWATVRVSSVFDYLVREKQLILQCHKVLVELGNARKKFQLVSETLPKSFLLQILQDIAFFAEKPVNFHCQNKTEEQLAEEITYDIFKRSSKLFLTNRMKGGKTPEQLLNFIVGITEKITNLHQKTLAELTAVKNELEAFKASATGRPMVKMQGKDNSDNKTTAGDEIVTFDQLIKLDDEREDTALALLGGSLDLVCTYSEGYKNRQPLYSCKTCFEKTGKLAGICYACSENCHEGHDLVELYSKRSFCCDCGNTKFDTKCKLFEKKDAFNKQNKYNDNFKGIFCSCKKPYPPDESDTQASEEDMIQCCMCEDWFHPMHIFPPDQQSIADEAEKGCSDDVEGLICKDCMARYSFLAFYTSANGSSDELSNTNQSQSAEEGNNECKLEAMRKKKSNADEEDTSKSVWVKAGWREELCRCKKCMNIYEVLDCTFLLEPEDTIARFEQQNREKAAQTKEHETALNLYSLGMEHMKDHCKKRAAEKRGPITGEDVDQCFAELRAKRTKFEEDSQQNDEL